MAYSHSNHSSSSCISFPRSQSALGMLCSIIGTYADGIFPCTCNSNNNTKNNSSIEAKTSDFDASIPKISLHSAPIVVTKKKKKVSKKKA